MTIKIEKNKIFLVSTSFIMLVIATFFFFFSCAQKPISFKDFIGTDLEKINKIEYTRLTDDGGKIIHKVESVEEINKVLSNLYKVQFQKDKSLKNNKYNFIIRFYVENRYIEYRQNNLYTYHLIKPKTKKGFYRANYDIASIIENSLD